MPPSALVVSGPSGVAHSAVVYAAPIRTSLPSPSSTRHVRRGPVNSTAKTDKDMEGVKEDLHYRFVFLRPPSLNMLEQRLRGRGTEDETSIQRRLQRARDELAYAETAGVYDRVVVNGAAVREVGEFLWGEK